MTEVIDNVSDHVLSVRGSSGMLLTRMHIHKTHVLRRYLLRAPCDTLFFFFFFFGLLALFRDFFAASFIHSLR